MYHMQLRNGKNQSGGLGLVGCFGGEIEPGETPKEAACRELAEESNVALAQDELEYLGDVRVDSEKHGKPASVHARIYRATVEDDYAVKAREGELVTMTPSEVYRNLHRLTSGSKACFRELLREEK